LVTISIFTNIFVLLQGESDRRAYRLLRIFRLSNGHWTRYSCRGDIIARQWNSSHQRRS